MRAAGAPDPIEYLIAGGAAGAISRTCVAPIERVKIIFQVRASHICARECALVSRAFRSRRPFYVRRAFVRRCVGEKGRWLLVHLPRARARRGRFVAVEGQHGGSDSRSAIHELHIFRLRRIQGAAPRHWRVRTRVGVWFLLTRAGSVRRLRACVRCVAARLLVARFAHIVGR